MILIFESDSMHGGRTQAIPKPRITKKYCRIGAKRYRKPSTYMVDFPPVCSTFSRGIISK